MLDELAVTNLAVLETARLHPGAGLTVVTGETGTGKTLLLGALGILLGDDFRPDRIGPFGDSAQIEARFVGDDGTETIGIRRRDRGGRTRSYLDGRMASAAELADELGSDVEIVAQHDQLRLSRPGELVRLLDGQLTAKGRAAREAYLRTWTDWLALERRAAAVGGDRRALERERDLLAHEAEQIEVAGLTQEEVDALIADADRLRHAEDLIGLLSEASIDVESIDESMGRTVNALRRAAALSGSFEPLTKRVEAIAIEVADVAAALRDEAESTHRDPTRLDQIDARLGLLSDLRRKFGETVEEINRYGSEAGERSARLAESLALADRLEADRERLRSELAVTGAALTTARRSAAGMLCDGALGHLAELGLGSAVLEVRFDPHPAPTATGVDRPVLYFASDRQLEPAPLAAAASGGELSRLVLALRLAGGIADASVIAFDEVDSGVGGRTALGVGEKLAALAEGRQVLCVTHLPQIAAFATTHFSVERAGGTARLRRLEGESRLAELTRMLAGIEATDSGRSHAEELLDQAKRRRAEPDSS